MPPNTVGMGKSTAGKAPAPSKKAAAEKPAARKKAAGKAALDRPKTTPTREEIFTQVCELIAEGKSLRTIEAIPGMPTSRTVLRWLADEDADGLRRQYARAREAQADYMAEEILAIADDGRNDTYSDEEGRVVVDHDVIARSRLRVDARKWLASKLAPKKYGDKLLAEHTGANGGAIEVRSTVTLVRPPKREGDDE